MTTTQPTNADHFHVFTYDGTYLAVWGGPMTEPDATAEARRLADGHGFHTIWVARYDDPCLHGNGAPHDDDLDHLQTQPPFWQRG